jgi:hypothetical protein
MTEFSSDQLLRNFVAGAAMLGAVTIGAWLFVVIFT